MKSTVLVGLVLGIGCQGAIGCASTGAPGEARQPEAAPHSHVAHSHADEPQSAPLETPGAAAEGPGPAGSPAGAPQGGPDTSRQELAAYEKAKPVFETYCANCHSTPGSKSTPKAQNHFNMDSYPFGGHHAKEMTATIRQVLGAGGSKPTMPKDKPGAVKGEELQLVLAWADASTAPTRVLKNHMEATTPTRDTPTEFDACAVTARKSVRASYASTTWTQSSLDAMFQKRQVRVTAPLPDRACYKATRRWARRVASAKPAAERRRRLLIPGSWK